MYSFSTSFAIFSLLASTQLFAGVHVESLSHERKSGGKVIMSLLKVPWIDLNSAWADEVAPTCRDDISTLFQSADAGEMWALQMLDASSKIPAGYLTGNIRDLGMYDECVRVKGHENPANIQGQHCMASMSMPPKYVNNAAAMLYVQQLSAYNPSASVDLSFTPSLCLPSSCSVDDVTGLVNASLQSSSELTGFGVKVVKVTCSDVQAYDKYTLGPILTISFFVVLAAFLVFCTACEFVVKKQPDIASLTLKNLAEFSLYSNTLRLWSTDVPDGTISALHGIRFMSMIIVMITHSMFVTLVKPMVNQEDIYKWREQWVATFLAIATFLVDNFLILSSMLSTYTFPEKMRSGARLAIPAMYFNRYVRLIPCLVAMILVTAFIGPHLGDGPLVQTVVPLATDACKKNWWTNLLFLQNLIDQQDICLPHTWYLALDMQLFVISPLILYPLFYRPKLGLSILGILSIGGFILPIIQILKHQYPFFVHGNKTFSKGWHDLVDFYPVTYNRSLPYFIGIFLGYYLLNVKRKLTKTQAAILWVLTVFAGAFFVWSGSYIQPNSPVFNVGWEATYASFGRLLWSLAFAWIVYACIRGHGGPIARFCSLPIFVPLSRLSYGIYLASPIIQTRRAVTIRTAEFYSILDALYIVGSDAVVSIAAAYLMYVCLESPVIAIEKILKKKRHSRTVKPASIKKEDKVSAPIAGYLGLPKDRVDSDSISSRMLQEDFWQNVSDMLNAMGKRPVKAPAELAKAWQDWESKIPSDRSQRKTSAIRTDNGHVNGIGNEHGNGDQDQTAQLRVETTKLEKRLLFFLAVVCDGRSNNEKLKGS